LNISEPIPFQICSLHPWANFTAKLNQYTLKSTYYTFAMCIPSKIQWQGYAVVISQYKMLCVLIYIKEVHETCSLSFISAQTSAIDSISYIPQYFCKQEIRLLVWLSCTGWLWNHQSVSRACKGSNNPKIW